MKRARFNKHKMLALIDLITELFALLGAETSAVALEALSCDQRERLLDLADSIASLPAASDALVVDKIRAHNLADLISVARQRKAVRSMFKGNEASRFKSTGAKVTLSDVHDTLLQVQDDAAEFRETILNAQLAAFEQLDMMLSAMGDKMEGMARTMEDRLERMARSISSINSQFEQARRAVAETPSVTASQSDEEAEAIGHGGK